MNTDHSEEFSCQLLTNVIVFQPLEVGTPLPLSLRESPSLNTLLIKKKSQCFTECLQTCVLLCDVITQLDREKKNPHCGVIHTSSHCLHNVNVCNLCGHSVNTVCSNQYRTLVKPFKNNISVALLFIRLF